MGEFLRCPRESGYYYGLKKRCYIIVGFPKKLSYLSKEESCVNEVPQGIWILNQRIS
jgi:hypothetical protein